VQGPGFKVVFADLDGHASRTIGSIDLAPVFHDLEALVSGRDLLPRLGIRAAGASQPTDESLIGWIVISFYAFDLDLAQQSK
jgi:hypothetical protein